MAESVEHLVVGAGPAGLRAAQVLAAAGADVLVLERNETVGPKTCAGGLSVKAVRELSELGLPPELGHTLVAHTCFDRTQRVMLDPERAAVRTVSRRALGCVQARWARAAGAEIRTGTATARIDLATRTVHTVRGTIRYRHLIGADGSASAVRRALRLPSPRVLFAAEFNIPGVRLPRLDVDFDSAALASGYFWIFPHDDYTSIGAGGHKRLVPPATLRPYLEQRMEELGVDPGNTPYEGATIEVAYHGLHFPGNVHLAGDAAGVASGLTAEGIYAALITGEEVAMHILEPGRRSQKVRKWMRIKRAHDALGCLWARRRARDVSFAALARVCELRVPRRWLSAFFLEG